VPIRPLLDDLTEAQARSYPLPGAHSIIELVAHMGLWLDVVAYRLTGNVKEPTAEEDWRDGTQLSWALLVEELDNAHSHLSDAIARLTVDDLDKIVVGRKYTTYVMLHGVIQHNLYHAGQIAILKKAILPKSSSRPA
jgi:hypothetical protein